MKKNLLFAAFAFMLLPVLAAPAQAATKKQAAVSNAEYNVKFVIYLPSDAPDAPADAAAKLNTFAAMTEEFFRKESQRLNLGKNNMLNFDRDSNGKVKLYVVRSTKTWEQIGQEGYWSPAYTDVSQVIDFKKSIALVIAPKGSYWLGGGVGSGVGGMAVVSDFFELLGTTQEEQNKIFLDKSPSPPCEYQGVTRGELASLRIGGAVHEIGHALYASHEADGKGLMSAGFWGFAQHFAPGSIRSEPTRMSRHIMQIFLNRPFFKADPGVADFTPPVMAATMEKLDRKTATVRIKVKGKDPESKTSIIVILIRGPSGLLHYETYTAGEGNFNREIKLPRVSAGTGNIDAVVYLYNRFGMQRNQVLRVTY